MATPRWKLGVHVQLYSLQGIGLCLDPPKVCKIMDPGSCFRLCCASFLVETWTDIRWGVEHGLNFGICIVAGMPLQLVYYDPQEEDRS